MEMSQAAARGNQPAFECDHLRSVQEAQSFIPQEPLSDEVLDRLIAEHWLKESRGRECRDVCEMASSQGICPVYPWLPESGQSQRYIHFSVFAATKANHFWCRFGRTIVCFDREKSTWKCSCSPMKRPCVHKALAKWYNLQHFPEMMTSASTAGDGSDDDVEAPSPTEEDSHTASGSHSSWAYPPTGDALERMIMYLRKKKIPADLSLELLDEGRLMKVVAVIPEETHCHFCSSKPPLTDPVLITSHGQLVTLNGVKNGITAIMYIHGIVYFIITCLHSIHVKLICVYFMY